MASPTKDASNASSRSSISKSPNYFTSAEVAARYTSIRPFFHDEVISFVCDWAGVAGFTRALDVGCGSGQSSVALAAVSDQVVAIDSSLGMLQHTASRANICYQHGAAERLDFEPESFDLVTAGSALHWFDQDRFFSACARVLAPAGILAVYNDHFTAHTRNIPECKPWLRSRFQSRYPHPKRGMRDIDEGKAVAGGFTIVHRAAMEHLVPFSRREFVSYLLTRSNTLAAIESGRETQQAAESWLDSELAPFFPDGLVGEFVFKCNLWLMRK